MKTELIEVSPTQKEIKIQIAADAVKDAYAKVSKKYAKGASVPGFRKGFAPLDVIRMRFKEEIKSEVLQDIVPQVVSEAVEEHGLQPLSEPHMHVEDMENVKVNGSQPIDLSVHVEVMPEIAQPKLDGFEFTRRTRPVAEADVEDIISKRLQEYAALIPVENRKSKTGDTVTADLEGKFEDEPDAEPITAENLEVVLGDEAIEKSFSENLVGVKEDEEKAFTVAYPADFTSAALAGKTVNYKAKIKSVAVTELPELNDEWAVSLDEGYESLADLRKKLRADLEVYAGSDADARVRNEAVAKLIEDNAFEVPNTFIENQARNLLNNFAEDLQRRGFDINNVENDFIQMAYTQMRTQAERDVRGAMLLDKIAEAEKVEVSDAEVEEEIAKLAEHYKTDSAEIRSSLEKQGGTATISNNLRTRKSIEALIAKAKITEGEWIDENQTEAVAEKPKKAAKAKKAETDDEKPAAKKEAKKKAAK